MKISSPVDLYWGADGWFRVQAAKVTTGKSDEEIYELAHKLSYKLGSDVNFDLNVKDFVGASLNYSLLFGTSVNVFMFFYGALTVAADILNTKYYLVSKKLQKDGMLLKEEDVFENISKYSRLPNLVFGTGFLLKPVYEFLTTRSFENPMGDVLAGLEFLSISASQYIKDSDEEGLKDREKKKLEKKLEDARLI